MERPADDRSAVAVALEWSATIMTISLEMVVPALLGYWLDQWLGTGVLFLLLGFALGGTLAALALLRIAQGKPRKRPNPQSDGEHGTQSTPNPKS